MKDKKKAIILDMDGTLESGTYIQDNSMMTLRPYLDELVVKLQEAKKQGIDIILCTTAGEQWVERFLTLRPELRTIFNKVFTSDNESEWKDYSQESNPLEYEAKQKDSIFENLKPVTTFGYDQILFIDDNQMEAEGLQVLFEMANEKIEKDVTYYSGGGFEIGNKVYEMLYYRDIANKNSDFAQLFEQYIKNERENPGCHIMSSVIDTFISKEFKIGLKLADQEYSKEYDLYYDKKSSLYSDLMDMEYDMELEIESENKLEEELNEYLSTDKAYPYEGIEIEKNKRETLADQIQEAKNLQLKLREAEKLKSDYEKNVSKEESCK